VKIEFVGELQRVDVRPGDIFILTTDHSLNDEMIKKLRDAWKDTWRGRKSAPELIVLCDGLKLAVVRQEDVAA
jgi:hypothetical protein